MREEVVVYSVTVIFYSDCLYSFIAKIIIIFVIIEERKKNLYE